MRKPAKTKAQKQHEREQRALLRLRRAAVRWSLLSESTFDAAKDAMPMAFANLGAACDAYTNALPLREQRRLGQLKPAELEPPATLAGHATTSKGEIELHLSDGRVLVMPDGDL
jgi:hypothetical protein